SIDLRIRHEYDSIDPFQDQLAARIVVDLPGYRIEVKPGAKPPDLPQLQRKEVEEQRAVHLRGQGDHLAAGFLGDARINVLEIGGFAAEAGTVIDDFAVDLARRVIDQRHVAMALL